MYIEIQQLKMLGLNKSQIARKLNISRPTVNKYISMTTDEFNNAMNNMNQRSKKPDAYKSEILDWLIEFPDLSATQVYDWLEEKYNALNFSEGTLRRYVRNLRMKHNLPNISFNRKYEAIPDPPMGKQMQVDFGEKRIRTSNGNTIKLYVMCFVLSHSRYKYCEWQDRPFTTLDVIRIHENAFEFYGGMPEEIVYDQDSLILTDENHGELVFTHAFAKYVKARKFRVYMCRKSDPESKGRIENVVGFVKKNFAHNRIFYNLERWNEDCISWLKRRGNGKIHGTTKKIPAQVFMEEQKYLRPVHQKIKQNSTPLSLTYIVKKDNIVLIGGNRYSVPLGTYKGPHTYVKAYKTDHEVIILDPENNQELARHELLISKGGLQKNNNHGRDRNGRIPELISELSQKFHDSFKANAFLQEIRKLRPRYIRDQIMVINSAIKGQTPEAINKALDFCVKNHLYSGGDFKDAVAHFGKEKYIQESSNNLNITLLSQDSLEKVKIKPQIRDMREYIKILDTTTMSDMKS